MGTADPVSQRYRLIARRLLRTLTPLVPGLSAPRSAAYAVLGLAQAGGAVPAGVAALRLAAL
ncbi:MAG TPA: hypothetical protein VJT31_06620, partial [Rugosimonospora sp.]|nr:hypothetical protein [Rugosimonospora sp.]